MRHEPSAQAGITSSEPRIHSPRDGCRPRVPTADSRTDTGIRPERLKPPQRQRKAPQTARGFTCGTALRCTRAARGTSRRRRPTSRRHSREFHSPRTGDRAQRVFGVAPPRDGRLKPRLQRHEVRLRGLARERSGPEADDLHRQWGGRMGKEYAVQLFSDGDGQVVRLPEECRLEGSAVRVRRQGSAMIIEPLEKPAWPEGYFARLKALAADLPDDFMPRSS